MYLPRVHGRPIVSINLTAPATSQRHTRPNFRLVGYTSDWPANLPSAWTVKLRSGRPHKRSGFDLALGPNGRAPVSLSIQTVVLRCGCWLKRSGSVLAVDPSDQPPRWPSPLATACRPVVEPSILRLGWPLGRVTTVQAGRWTE